MANPFKNFDEFEKGIEGIAQDTSRGATKTVKTVVSDAQQQAGNPQDWLDALYGPSDASVDQGNQQAQQAQQMAQQQQVPHIPEQRQGDEGIEDPQAKKQQEEKKKKEHLDRHMTTYWEPLFGKSRRERIKQEEEQKKKAEEEQEEQQTKQMEDLEKKEKKEKLPITRARTKAETGIGNAGG